MEQQMINQHRIIQLRQHRNWSQDQLATVAGLSLRTIQRIENEGRCSLESKKALAAAFEVEADVLERDIQRQKRVTGIRWGAGLGFAGVCAGGLSAWTGISDGRLSGALTAAEAGVYFGSIGVFCGLCCGLAGLFFYKNAG